MQEKRKIFLFDYKEEIETKFQINPPKTIKEAVSKIKEITGKEYSENYIDVSLKKLGMNINKKFFKDYKEKIEREFQINPPKTTKEAVSKIKEITGKEYSQTHIRRFFCKHGE